MSARAIVSSGSLAMIKYAENGDFAGLACDECERPSPPTKDSIINKGLIGLGWYCLGGKHLCPDCK